MDILLDGDLPPDFSTLSYDDSVAYEEQVPTHPANDPPRASLANRIGSTKVYLLLESSVTRSGKRKHVDQDDQEDPADVEMDEDSTQRGNALLLHGPPISHLPTARIFAYATHFDVHPMGLEWVDDTTCVFVFESQVPARTAHRFLRKSAAEEPDVDGFVTAKPIPIALWPPEERINKSLGVGEGLKGIIRMRWARVDDVKKKGAKQESKFYKVHGETAGKEIFPEKGEGIRKRRRREEEDIDVLEKAQLDDDLDRFLAEDDEEPEEPPSPPSKMRSDYIANDGRTLLERTSEIRVHLSGNDLASRITAPLPRRARRDRIPHGSDADPSSWNNDTLKWGRGGNAGRGKIDEKKGSRRGGERPTKSQQELDDELDAFLKERN